MSLPGQCPELGIFIAIRAGRRAWRDESWCFQEDAKAGHPIAVAWKYALKVAAAGAPIVPTQSAGVTRAAGQLHFRPTWPRGPDR